jgi:hypothetical protein
LAPFYWISDYSKISPLTIDDVRKAVGYGIVMGGNKLFDNSDDKSGE